MQLSVDRYVGRSVDHVVSAQYLLTLQLINTKLGAGVALNELMIPIDFQGHMFKGQGQTTVVHSISFDPFT